MSAMTTAQMIEHEIGANGALVLKLVEGSVRIRGVDGTVARVTVEAPGLEDRIGVDRLPGELQVRVPEQFLAVGWLGVDLHGLFSPRRSVTIEVEVPRAASVEIDGASTRVSGDGLVGEQRIHLVSGDVRLEAGGGRIRVDGVSGRVAVSAIAPVGVAVRTVSGDITIDAPSITELRVGSMSSAIDASGAFVGGGPFRIETVSGRCVVSTDSALRVESHSMAGRVSSERPGERAMSGDGRTFAFGQHGPTLTFHSMSGSLLVRPSAAGTGHATANPSADAMTPGSTDPPGWAGGATAAAPGPETPRAPGADAPVSSGAATQPSPGADAPPMAAAGADPRQATAGAWTGSQLAGDARVRDEASPAGLTGSGPAGAEPAGTEPAGTDERGADQSSAARALTGGDRITILRALERGEIDVDEAARRLENLDARGA